MDALKKYIILLLVLVQFTGAAGIPVYLHYCGGELEEISYLTKTNGCCGDEEPDGDCCANEDLVLQNDQDLIIKESKDLLTKQCIELPGFFLSYLIALNPSACTLCYQQVITDHPPALQEKIISVTVLRI